MSTSKKSEQGIASASATAKEVLEFALQKLKDTVVLDDGTPARLFFPNGIELIDITVKVSPVEIQFKVAGPKAEAQAQGAAPTLDATSGEG